MTDRPEFYWVNLYNLRECGGPYVSVEDAAAICRRDLEAAGGSARAVVIARAVAFLNDEPGEVQRRMNYVGEKQDQ